MLMYIYKLQQPELDFVCGRQRSVHYHSFQSGIFMFGIKSDLRQPLFRVTPIKELRISTFDGATGRENPLITPHTHAHTHSYSLLSLPVKSSNIMKKKNGRKLYCTWKD